MSNPIFNNSPKTKSNGLFDMLLKIKNSPNPNAAMQEIFASNPQYQNIMSYISQNGGDARSAFYNMAAQKGIDPNSILDKLR